MKVITMVCSKKIRTGEVGVFWAQKLRILITLDSLEELFFFILCTMKGANR